MVAQRLKRLSSIEAKLRIEKNMQLSRMQDIGGCRAVLSNVRSAYALNDSYRSSKYLRHHFVKENDYILGPKQSGYRSIHRIYRYVSDRTSTYNGLLIEVQIRSQLQHAWASAVETVGTFLRQALKASKGSAEWLHFFKLMGTAMAMQENTAPVPGTPTDVANLIKELRKYARNLRVEEVLKAYSRTIQAISEPKLRDQKYFLIELRPVSRRVTIKAYREKDLQRATEEYMEVERTLIEEPGSEAVLVSVESLDSLRRAYPSYFLDTDIFLDALSSTVS